MKVKNGKDFAAGRGRFGTFAGVFTPTVLTILGLILFLRMGWVVGQAGLLWALVIIVISNAISAITGLSLSSIATNMNVRAGGTYYMIARTLGLQIGGAIGIPLYFSQAISVAFYIIGFTEAFTSVFPTFDPQTTATVLALIFGFMAYVGAGFALKIQFAIMGIMALSFISLFAGGSGAEVVPHLLTPPTCTASFWQVFAIFFPAVTGIMVGVSMSGDLKDPTRSIPRGTLGAILVTSLIYVVIAFWLATHATTAELVSDNMIMRKIARWPVLIIAGIWASTLSSALGSILAAPRTLQAISQDRAVPKVLGARLGSTTEPRLAVIITSAIAVAVIWMGNLDFVAPIITMFFLNTYGMINLMAGIERLVANPSFRPQFKVPWIVSLIGAIGCYVAMCLINASATVVAILISYGVFLVLQRRSLQQDWGDVRSGIWYTVARFGLVRLDREPWHVKNWRPNLVVFTSLSRYREPLMELGAWLCSGRGVATFWHLLLGEIDGLSKRGLRTTSAKHMDDFLNDRGVVAFAESTIANDFHTGVVNVMQSHGLAGLEPNTALFAWSNDQATQVAQLKLMRDLLSLGKSVMFLRHEEKYGFGKKKRIDIWWRGRDRNAELMLVLAHIIQQSRQWERAEIRVCWLMDKEAGIPGAKEHIAKILAQVRVEAEPKIFLRSSPDEPFDAVLRRASGQTDLIILGLRAPQPGDIERQAEDIRALFPTTATALLVRSGEVEDILDTERGV
jgi:amino acid transporter